MISGMKRVFLLSLFASLFFLSPVSGLPRLALAKFLSSSFEVTKLDLLTDALRSEVFKTGLFLVQDQPWIDRTKPAGTDKGLSGTIEKFGTAVVINLKVVDLATGVLDFSETDTIADEAKILQSLKELTAKLAVRYRYGSLASGVSSPEETGRMTVALWKSQGAEGAVLDGLVALGEGPETYLSFRQYDGSISPAEYLELHNKGVDLEALRTFLQSGISYREARRALTAGITRLENYQATFQPAGFSFAEFLDAYELGLPTLKEYKRYLAESVRDFLSLGLGGAADKLPLGATNFKLVLGQVSWEHSWMKKPNDWYRVNTEAGLLLLDILLPTPYFGINLMVGNAPFFVKAGVGAHAEMLVGGHIGFEMRLGLEVASQFEFTVLAVPFGTEPSVNYTDNFKPITPSDSWPIKFPFYGILFTYKLPLVGKAH